MEEIIDLIFNPAINFLGQIKNYLYNTTQLINARRLTLDYFLGPVSMISYEWRVLITSIISLLILISTIFVAKKIYTLYLNLKEGVKWW